MSLCHLTSVIVDRKFLHCVCVDHDASAKWANPDHVVIAIVLAFFKFSLFPWRTRMQNSVRFNFLLDHISHIYSFNNVSFLAKWLMQAKQWLTYVHLWHLEHYRKQTYQRFSTFLAWCLLCEVLLHQNWDHPKTAALLQRDVFILYNIENSH